MAHEGKQVGAPEAQQPQPRDTQSAAQGGPSLRSAKILSVDLGKRVKPAKMDSRGDQRGDGRVTKALQISDYESTQPWTRYARGYPRFAAFIAHDPDKSTAIYRRFKRLSARNLLYLESELSELETEQDELDDEAKRNEDIGEMLQNWDLMYLRATEKDSEAEEQIQAAAQRRLDLAMRIRDLLKTYYEALKLESEILALRPPDRRPLKGTRRIFKSAYLGLKKKEIKQRPMIPGDAMISGAMKTHLDPKNDDDLCVLAEPVESDRLTKLLEGRFSYFFRTRTEDGLTDIVSHKRVSRAVSIISSLLAIIFLIGAVLGLYWVKNPNAKLGMLSGLTFAFACSLALFTNARRQDVFAATAAYAAVLVVFISGNLAGATNGNPTPQTPMQTQVLLVTSTAITTATTTTFIASFTTETVSIAGATYSDIIKTVTEINYLAPVTQTQTSYVTRPAVASDQIGAAGAAGIGVGTGAGVLLVFFVVVCFCSRQRKKPPNRRAVAFPQEMSFQAPEPTETQYV